MRSTSTLDHENAVAWARRLVDSPDFVVLDTETTGLTKTDEICSIAVVDGSGAVLLDTLVKPGKTIPWDATRIHGISNIDVDKSPRFAEIHADVSRLLHDRVVVGYNVEYDMGLIRYACKHYKLPAIKPSVSDCAMKWYAQYYGAWNDLTRDYKWHRLGVAAARLGIETTGTHSAVGDCRLTLELIRRMAAS